MAYSELIIDLYSTVFQKQKIKFGVSECDIIHGMADIGKAYLPDPNWEYKEGDSPSYYYDDAAHRCAYLHKYAMLHTGLLCDLLEQALNVSTVNAVLNKVGCLEICSLGSGPGTDIVACLMVLKEHFGGRSVRANLIDCCEGWQFVFEAIVSELEQKSYDREKLWDFEYIPYEYWYVVTDLLEFDGHDFEVTPAIKSADVVTMVKFVSAAACRDTRRMVKAIFRAMKTGALLFFVDNSSGGFHEMMSETAKECGMISVFDSLHYYYKEEEFRREYWKWISQYEARVAVEIWRKTETYCYGMRL